MFLGIKQNIFGFPWSIYFLQRVGSVVQRAMRIDEMTHEGHENIDE